MIFVDLYDIDIGLDFKYYPCRDQQFVFEKSWEMLTNVKQSLR